MFISPQDFKDKIRNQEHLPEGLVVTGGLYLHGYSPLTNLPEGLKVNGSLSLHGCTTLTHLPEGLRVMGYLNLGYNTSLIHLPEGLVVGGDLNLFNCTSLTHLPEGLMVEGIIYCDESLIDNIPTDELPLYINLPFNNSISSLISNKIKYYYEKKENTHVYSFSQPYLK